ncbi:hypothetical protein R3W88_007880 [Solanum pinnatisectum]|uniref:Gag-pol polyprotein n=1 Tax=Solanum pinnatisectum TaxID=50273 RepID=A0AAV9M8Y1_9SOLN|nr:hypothetical protein R3W88_007880 [Solanum pinnatisectum]
MLYDNMDISRQMVHAQQVEESRIRKKSREVKRPRLDNGNSSKGKFEGQSGPRFKKRFSNQGSSNALRPNKDRVGHQLEDYPTRETKGKEGNQATPSGSKANAPKKNRFYGLQSRSDQEGSPYVVTDMLQVFSIDVYALLDHSATLSFVPPFVAMKFEVPPEELKEFFCVYPGR